MTTHLVLPGESPCTEVPEATVHGVTKNQTQLSDLAQHICHEVMGLAIMILGF